MYKYIEQIFNYEQISETKISLLPRISEAVMVAVFYVKSAHNLMLSSLKPICPSKAARSYSFKALVCSTTI